ncbi:MAG: GNAT family N-acetyltransferase [Pseudomonadota bacterium]
MTDQALRPGFEIHGDAAVLARASPADLTDLTCRATDATFYRDGLTPEQTAANLRVVEISGPTCAAAAQADHQHLAAAFIGDELAGYVIATRHAPDDLELDWLMVDPAFHGSGVAAGLMQAGIAWLGQDQPMWLNVIAYNARAIAFYEKFGFAVDPDATTPHAIPHHIMRRSARSMLPGADASA